MVLRCLRAELMKCRRAPVWLAFLVLPLFPAVLGTFNYLGNLEVLDAGWYSLWTQHTLFASMFFLPAQFGVFCAWQWRLEHADHNWNAALTAPVPVRALYLGKLLLDVGGVRPGHGPHRPALSPQRQAGRYLRPPCPRSCRLAGLGAWLYGGVRRTALPQSGHPRLRPAGSHRPGGWNLRPAPYQPGLRRRLSLLPALPGYAGQQPPDGPAPPLLSGGLRVLPSALLSAGRTAALPPGCRHRVKHTPACHSTRGYVLPPIEKVLSTAGGFIDILLCHPIQSSLEQMTAVAFMEGMKTMAAVM